MKQEFDFLDDFLKEKVENVHFGMKEEYWQKMSALLDEQDNGKKKGFPYWRGLSVLFLLLATCIGAYVVPKFVTKRSSAEPESRYEQNKPSELAAATLARINDTVSGKDSAIPAANQDALSTTSHNTATPSIVPTSNSTSETKERKQNHAVIATNNVTPSASQLTSYLNSEKQRVTVTYPKKSKSRKHAKHLSTAVKSTQAVAAMAPQDQQNDVIPASTNSVPDQASSTPSITDPSVHYTNGIAYRPIDTQVISTRRVLTPEESNPRYHADLLNYQPEYIELVTIITSKPLADNTANRTTSSSEKPLPVEALSDEQKTDWSRRMRLFALAGLNINKGLKGDAENQIKYGLSPFVGFGIEKPINRDLSVSSSLGFTYFNGLNQVRRDNYYTYSFGVDSTLQSYYTKKLYQLYLPLSLTYHINEKHQFMGGIGLTYSFGSSGFVQEDLYKASANTSGLPSTNKTSSNVTPITTDVSGFQTFDFFLQAGYSYQVVKSLYAQVMMQQGFLDISRNNYYNNSVNNTLTRVSVGVRYNLPSLRKK